MMKFYNKRIRNWFNLNREVQKTNHNLTTIERGGEVPTGFIQEMLEGKRGGLILKNVFSEDKLSIMKNFRYTFLNEYIRNNNLDSFATFPDCYAFHSSKTNPDVGKGYFLAKEYFKNTRDQINYVNSSLGFNLWDELRLQLKTIDPSWHAKQKDSPFSDMGFTPFSFRGINNQNQVAYGAHRDMVTLDGLDSMNHNLKSSFRLPVFSVIIMLEKQKGGRLIFFNKSSDPSIPPDFNDRSHIDLEEGDLLLFDGSETYHAVEPIDGDGTRQSLGYFVNVVPETKTLELWI